MDTTEKNEQPTSGHAPILKVDKENGFYNSVSIVGSPSEFFEFCQDIGNVDQVLADLPMGVDDYLDLKMVSARKTGADQYEIKWENKLGSKVKGKLTFLLTPAPVDRGTYLTAEAVFDGFHIGDEAPSTLMKTFIKRMKALKETGVLATTTGQPSGREELDKSKEKYIH